MSPGWMMITVSLAAPRNRAAAADLPLDGTPVTLQTTAPGQEAYFTKPATNTVTLRAYKIPKNESTLRPDGTPVSVTTTVPGERPVLRFSGGPGTTG